MEAFHGFLSDPAHSGAPFFGKDSLLVNAHSLTVLEFEKVRRMLLRWTFSAPGIERVAGLQPDLGPEEIDLSLARISEWKTLEISGRAPTAPEVPELRPLLARLVKAGDVLAGSELAAFVPLLQQMRDLRARIRPDEDRPLPHLVELVAPLPDVAELARRLERSISPDGEVRSEASPRLARARAELADSQRAASEQLQNLLERLSPDRREDAFVTLRDDRYVVSIRNHDRELFPGFVHGRSGSGHSVLVEPIEALDLNNRLADRREDVRQEELRVLRELTDALRSEAGALAGAYDIIGICDLVRAGAKLALRLRAEAPDWNAAGRIRIVAGRHPLLADAAAAGGAPVVPLDLEIGGERSVLLVSGPNMGGKTVALKTVGLLTLMLRAGLHVPAEPGTDLPLVDEIFVDLGDEQSIEADLSTFAAHFRNIGELWEGATDRSLVLLDELGGGTDPEEGAALAMAVLTGLAERRTLTVATTHLTALKLYAQEAAGMGNGSMEFDAVSLQPRFRLMMGEVGRSRAFEIAARILPGSGLLARAQAFRSPQLVELDRIFERVDAERRALAAERGQLEAARRELADQAAKRARQAERLSERVRAVRESRDRLVDEAYQKALAEVAAIRKELEDALRQGRDGRGLEAARQAERRVQRRRASRDRVHRRPEHGTRLDPGGVIVGGQAWIPDLRALVRIERIDPEAGKVRVDWQGRHLEVSVSALEAPPEGAVRVPSRAAVRYETGGDHVSRELDLRGQRAADALELLERFLDQAAMAGLGQVRIVHGKGTGTLKREVEAALGRHPLVESSRTGESGEGGWGVTVVALARASRG